MIYTVLTWLIMVISVFLVIVVLVQNSKGGGITNNFLRANSCSVYAKLPTSSKKQLGHLQQL